MLPDFIVIGAYKAATTSLHHYFDQHPQIFMTVVKEPNFFAFDENNPQHRPKERHQFRIRTLERYESLFEDALSGQQKGEVSPVYFSSAFAARRIHDIIPTCRLILSLRNPVDRAYSAYQMAYRTGGTQKKVEEVLPSDAPWLRKSLYAQSIQTYLDLFGRSQLTVVFFEDIQGKPREVMRSLFDYVGVDPNFQVDVSYRFNPGGMPRSTGFFRISMLLRRIPGVLEYTPKFLRRAMARARDRTLKKAEPLDRSVRAAWIDWLHEDILRTQELIGVDLGHWIESK
jgi:hypothetical protein